MTNLGKICTVQFHNFTDATFVHVFSMFYVANKWTMKEYEQMSWHSLSFHDISVNVTGVLCQTIYIIFSTNFHLLNVYLFHDWLLKEYNQMTWHQY